MDWSPEAQKILSDAGTGTRPVPLTSEDPAYATLKSVLDEAYAQSASGKGKERHANDRPFERQPILEISRMCGAGYPAGQAQKKLQEAIGMAKRGERERAVAECLGAIVYAAALVVLLRET